MNKNTIDNPSDFQQFHEISLLRLLGSIGWKGWNGASDGNNYIINPIIAIPVQF